MPRPLCWGARNRVPSWVRIHTWWSRSTTCCSGASAGSRCGTAAYSSPFGSVMAGRPVAGSVQCRIAFRLLNRTPTAVGSAGTSVAAHAAASADRWGRRCAVAEKGKWRPPSHFSANSTQSPASGSVRDRICSQPARSTSSGGSLTSEASSTVAASVMASGRGTPAAAQGRCGHWRRPGR